MLVPKNIMQIGTPDDFYRIYIEDYVYTYIKQLEKEADIGRKKVYLFGRKENTQEEMVLYIYGAADSEKGILSIQHEFFPDYDILGIMTLTHNIKEISLQNGIAFNVKGYYVFYEQNTSMQSFLVHNFQESEKADEIEEPRIRLPRQDGKNISPPSNNMYKGKEYNSGKLLYSVTFIMAIVICIIAITAINQYDKMLGFNKDILQAGNMNIDTTTESETQTTFYIEEVHESEKTEETLTSTEESVETTAETSIDNEESTQTQESIQSDNKMEDIATYQEYTVKKGDNLAFICRQFYGNDDNVKEICRINEISDPDSIQPGQKILLP